MKVALPWAVGVDGSRYSKFSLNSDTPGKWSRTVIYFAFKLHFFRPFLPDDSCLIFEVSAKVFHPRKRTLLTTSLFFIPLSYFVFLIVQVGIRNYLDICGLVVGSLECCLPSTPRIIAPWEEPTSRLCSLLSFQCLEWCLAHIGWINEWIWSLPSETIGNRLLNIAGE